MFFYLLIGSALFLMLSINILKEYERDVIFILRRFWNVIERHALDDILSDRGKLNADLQRIIDSHTDNWDIKVFMVEIKK